MNFKLEESKELEATKIEVMQLLKGITSNDKSKN